MGVPVPRPDREIERKSTGSGPVKTYKLSQEELDKLSGLNGLTKQLLLEAIAAGKTLTKVEQEYGMKKNTIYPVVSMWGLKGMTAEKAKELLAVSEAKSQASKSTAAPTNESLEKQLLEAQSQASNARGAMEELKVEIASLRESLASERVSGALAVERIADLEKQLAERGSAQVFDRLGSAIDLLTDLAQLKTPALQSVIEERQRQDAKWGVQNHPPVYWMAILGEEFGELCQAVNETVFDNGLEERKKGGCANIRAEAVQVAAVAVALVELIDRSPTQCEVGIGG